MKRNAQANDLPWMKAADPDESGAVQPHPSGRWPANVIHDGSEEVLEGFPETKGGIAVNRNRGVRTPSLVNYANHDGIDHGHGDSGSAARFFYCAKASKAERTHGSKITNKHPTVKPLDLMRYLCRLVRMPQAGIVLDPFMGSGTTGLACRLEGQNFVGIEQDAEAWVTATNRLAMQLAEQTR